MDPLVNSFRVSHRSRPPCTNWQLSNAIATLGHVFHKEIYIILTSRVPVCFSNTFFLSRLQNKYLSLPYRATFSHRPRVWQRKCRSHIPDILRYLSNAAPPGSWGQMPHSRERERCQMPEGGGGGNVDVSNWSAHKPYGYVPPKGNHFRAFLVWNSDAEKTLFKEETDTCSLMFSCYYPCNPFTPESDQCQISPAASPEIVHHTVWRTWLFIAYSDERWLHYQFLLLHLHTFSLKCSENVLFELRSERVDRIIPIIGTSGIWQMSRTIDWD